MRRSWSSSGILVSLVEGPDAPPDAWARIADAWPVWAPPARIARLAPEAAESSRRESLGHVVVVAGLAGTELFKVIDTLRQEHVATLVLAHEPTSPASAGAMPGSVLVPESEDPASVAAAIAALADRQRAFDALHAELDVARRFQGGLRGEMNKLHEELQLAASVQHELLPKALPTVDGVEFGVMFRPAGYVSGDIYNVDRLDEHHLGFFLADAVGHGVPAALLTMIIAQGMCMKSIEGDAYTISGPGAALERLNRLLVHRHASAPRFATAVAGVIDTRDRTVTLAGAGHPAPLIFGPGGASRMELEGGMLGVFEEDTFDECTFALGDEELMIIYSDGFETAFPDAQDSRYAHKMPNRRFLNRFGDLSERWRDQGMQGALAQLGASLDGAAGSLHQVDDITALVLAPRPVAASQPATEHQAAA